MASGLNILLEAYAFGNPARKDRPGHVTNCSLFNTERSLTSRAIFKLNRSADLAEWRGLSAA